MGFRVICEKKGCGKDIEPLLDKGNDKVVCPCEEQCEITQLNTHFSKVSMASMGQVLSSKSQKQSFGVRCPSCNREATPVLKTEARTEQGSLKAPQLHCKHCNHHLTHLSGPYTQMLKEFIGAQKRAGG